MKTIRKELVYYMPYVTEKDIQKAQIKRLKLYDKYNTVRVYPNGLHEVKIVATDKIDR